MNQTRQKFRNDFLFSLFIHKLPISLTF